MKIYVTSVFVNDQREALKFYTEILGFEKKNDIPVGEHSWLTVTAKGEQDGTELLLEPNDHPAVAPFREALIADGIPSTSFQVENLDAEYEHLCDKGVVFTQTPMEAGSVKMAVFDDTCGNLIQLVEMINEG
jgi:catechol 2,3-dioxygenase-like lactoylglutathione lyase family enzyme